MTLKGTKASADAQAATEILEVLSDAVLAVGAILERVYVERPTFEDFVLTNLPMRPDTAERIRAMFLIHAEKNGHTELPEPWKALWQFS